MQQISTLWHSGLLVSRTQSLASNVKLALVILSLIESLHDVYADDGDACASNAARSHLSLGNCSVQSGTLAFHISNKPLCSQVPEFHTYPSWKPCKNLRVGPRWLDCSFISPPATAHSHPQLSSAQLKQKELQPPMGVSHCQGFQQSTAMRHALHEGSS